MKKQLQSLWTLGAMAAFLTFGITLDAQQSAPPPTSTDPSAASQPQTTQPTDPTAQRPATQAPSQTPPSQTPNQGSQSAPDSSSQTSASAGEGQSFSGTIVKSGDKFMLQDADTGKSYDIDHQEQVKQYEGKKVRVHGTLDANNKIHVQ
jgi:hypothetical protein